VESGDPCGSLDSLRSLGMTHPLRTRGVTEVERARSRA
jgi:hypothetical protein